MLLRFALERGDDLADARAHMDSRNPGLILIALGVGLTLLGLLVWSGATGFFGRLPGDFRYEGEHTRIYVPLASCVLISVVLSLLAALARRFF